MPGTLYLIGTPLQESTALDARAGALLLEADIIVGETRKVLDRYLKPFPAKAPRFHLDPLRKDEWEDLQNEIKRLAKENGKVALLSDVGMPILFDPGSEVLSLCRTEGYSIRTLPSATSWATACAVSGYQPPFYIQGFLHRDNAQRMQEIKTLKTLRAHTVLMETPYRFLSFLDQMQEAFGESREAFLSWDIAGNDERHVWANLKDLKKYAKTHQLEKGEFILILKAK